MTSSVRHLCIGALLLTLVCAVAVAGYMLAGWSWGDAVYMAVITVFTVGYGEVRPVETPGLQLFTILFIAAGCTAYLYIGGALVHFLIAGQIESILGRRRMTRSIEKLHHHTIICGYGRVGRILAEEFHEFGHPFVVIDHDDELRQELHERGFPTVMADATDETALLAAGIERASNLAIVLPNDASNVFIALSARNLNPRLSIVARGMTPSTEQKLRQAGADRVVLPEHIGAERIAGLILRPTASSLVTDGAVISYLVNDLAELGLDVEEFSVPEGSNLAGLTLADLETAGRSAFLVVAVVRAGGTAIQSPPLDTRFEAGDILVVVCHQGHAPAFEEQFEVTREFRGARGDS